VSLIRLHYSLWLLSGFSAHVVAFRQVPVDFQCVKAATVILIIRLPFLRRNLCPFKPIQFRLLFPGEAIHLATGSRYSGKKSVWALYARALLLWNNCVDMSRRQDLDSMTHSSFAVRVWQEVDIIERALQTHICKTEEHYLWAGRQYLQL
jgi:hypothetical protein